MFKVNQYIVYKKNVCLIKEIKEHLINDKDYFVLIPVTDPSLKIEIPTDNKNIRKLITKKEAEQIIERIPNIEVLDNINDRMLENQYKELLNQETHESLIKIIKTTYLRNQKRINNNKKIGEIDQNYFKLAEKFLYNELSIALNKSVEEIKQYIIDITTKK